MSLYTRSGLIVVNGAGAIFSDAGSGQTFDFYIGPSGNNANAGTVGSPWSLSTLCDVNLSGHTTQGGANRTAAAGKRIGILPGTYNCLSLAGGAYWNNTSAFGEPAFSPPSGSLGSPTVVGACNAGGFAYTTSPGFSGGVWQGPTFDGGMNDTNNPQFQPLWGTVSLGFGYCVTDGIEMKNTNDRIMSFGGDTGLTQHAGNRSLGIVVRNCYLHAVTSTSAGSNSAGITCYTCDGALIENNYITDITNSNNRETGIEVWTSINTVFQKNDIILSAAGAGGIFAKNNFCWGQTIQQNFIDLRGVSNPQGWVCDSDGTGSNTSTIQFNVILGRGPVRESAINVNGFPNWAENFIVRNNTMVGDTNWNVVGFRRFSSALAYTYYNNILSRTSAGGDDSNVNISTFALTDYNLYPSSFSLHLTADGSASGGSSFTSFGTYAANLNAGCVGKEAHSLNGSPTYVNASGTRGSDWALNGGTGSGTGSTDGTIGGTGTDMGAFGNGNTQVGTTWR
jgi:hypothetical protein